MSVITRLFSFDWMRLSVPEACLGDFRHRLLLKTVVPLAAVAALVLGSIVIAVSGDMETRAAIAARMIWLTGGTQTDALGEAHAPSHSYAALSTMLKAARRGCLSILPLTLALFFALVPSVASHIFSTFDCEGFGNDDALGTQRYYLMADSSVECVGSGFDALRALSAALIFLWPVGVPALFFGLLVAGRRDVANGRISGGGRSGRVDAPKALKQQEPSLFQAVSFVHADYQPELYFWELLELVRKLALTGFVLLVPQRFVLLRLLLALLLSIGHLVLLQVCTRILRTNLPLQTTCTDRRMVRLLQAASPYRQLSTAVFALSSGTTLICTLLAALLVRMYASLPVMEVVPFFGFQSVQPLVILILCFNFSVLGSALLLVSCHAETMRRTLSARRIRYTGTNIECTSPRLQSGETHHLFLSQ